MTKWQWVLLQVAVIELRSQILNININVKSDNLVTVGAKPRNSQLHGYSGAVLRYRNSVNQSVISYILCESGVTGIDGNRPTNAPIAKIKDGNNTLRCAPG